MMSLFVRVMAHLIRQILLRVSDVKYAFISCRRTTHNSHEIIHSLYSLSVVPVMATCSQHM